MICSVLVSSWPVSVCAVIPDLEALIAAVLATGGLPSGAAFGVVDRCWKNRDSSETGGDAVDWAGFCCSVEARNWLVNSAGSQKQVTRQQRRDNQSNARNHRKACVPSPLSVNRGGTLQLSTLHRRQAKRESPPLITRSSGRSPKPAWCLLVAPIDVFDCKGLARHKKRERTTSFSHSHLTTVPHFQYAMGSRATEIGIVAPRHDRTASASPRSICRFLPADQQSLAKGDSCTRSRLSQPARSSH